MTAKRIPDAARAYAVLDFIKANPERHEQGIWMDLPWQVQEGDRPLDTTTWCGTAACFAGWTSLLAGDKPVTRDDPGYRSAIIRDFDSPAVRSADTRRLRPVHVRAAELLGLSETKASQLFSAYNTVEDIERLIGQFFGPRPSAS